MGYSFSIFNEYSIRLGDRVFPIKTPFGIEPSKFMSYYENLRDNYSFNIKQIEFNVTWYGFLSGETGKKGIVRPINEYIDFVMYSNILEQEGIDINNLVRQFNHSRDYYEIRHIHSLTILTYIYHKNGFKIQYLPKGADFTINDIKADVKVVQPEILRLPPKEKKLTSEGYLDIKNEIILEMSKRISSRFLEGCKQADVLFFDLTSKMGFGALTILFNEFDKIVEPKKYRLIFYYKKRYPHGEEIFHKIKNTNKSLGKRYFPNLYSFKGYFIDFEPYLWKFFSNVDLSNII